MASLCFHCKFYFFSIGYPLEGTMTPLTYMYGMGTVCLVLLLTNISLIAIIVILCCHHKKKHPQTCKCTCACQISQVRHEYVEMPPVNRNYNHSTSAMSILSKPNTSIRSASIAPNPVSTILIRVAHLYWSQELTETTILSSLQHVLIEVLQDKRMASTPEMKSCIKELRDEIIYFAEVYEMQNQQKMCKYSRQNTYTVEGAEIEGGKDETDMSNGVMVPQINEIAIILTKWMKENNIPYTEAGTPCIDNIGASELVECFEPVDAVSDNDHDL